MNIAGGDIPIIDLLPTNYHLYSNSLFSRGILFLTQFLSRDFKKLLRWEELKSSNVLLSTQRRMPPWYKELFCKLYDDEQEGPLSMRIKMDLKINEDLVPQTDLCLVTMRRRIRKWIIHRKSNLS